MSADPREVRDAIRAGWWRGTTRGAAPGYVQCNIVVLPEPYARWFDAWCAANPQVAPLLARGEPGDPRLPSLGRDLDVRTDLPGYRVFREGAAAGETGRLTALWRDDLVTYAFGCSFSLEDALRRAGVALRYEQRGFGGAIYRTALDTAPAGPFAAPCIVSMRPLRPGDAEAAAEVAAALPSLHGAPVHTGDPAAIGVDLDRPLDAIGTLSVAGDEVPVFWACGVTAQEAVAHAAPPIAFTHVSSRMLVTDLPIEAA